MTIPAADLATTHLDAGTDDPSQARAQIKAIADKLNTLLNDLGVGSVVWNNSNDGPTSGLSAQYLGGQDSAYHRNASNINAGTLNSSRLPSIPLSLLPTIDIAHGGTNATTASAARTNLGLGGLATLSSVAAAQIDTDAVDSAEIKAGAIHQPELDTSMSEVSQTGGEAYTMRTLPGGQYGFYPQIKLSASGAGAFAISGDGYTGTSYITNIGMKVAPGGHTAYAQQRYINSSPPLFLGDIEVAQFIFVLLNKKGEVVSVYNANVPPWLYNGPTRTAYDFVNKKGEKFQRRIKIVDFENGIIERKMVPITQEIKNADMDLIPHPFYTMEQGEVPVLLDPGNTEILRNLFEAGESINELIHNDYIRIDNEQLKRTTPKGVIACPWKWKKTK